MKIRYIASFGQLVVIWASGVTVGMVLATVFHFAKFVICLLLGWY